MKHFYSTHKQRENLFMFSIGEINLFLLVENIRFLGADFLWKLFLFCLKGIYLLKEKLKIIINNL
jgi:hypothetical protein